ncbi:MAG: hypothetical protein WAN51_09015 [Alphaproteobacteria bacterium]
MIERIRIKRPVPDRSFAENVLSDLVSYELQTFLGGAWKIDSIYDDREIAVYEAQRLQATGRFSAIRVVEEKFDSGAGKSVVKTVFRFSKTEAENARAMEQQKTARQEVQTMRNAAGADEFEPSGQRPMESPKQSGLGVVPLILILGAVILGGLFLLVAMQSMLGVRL